MKELRTNIFCNKTSLLLICMMGFFVCTLTACSCSSTQEARQCTAIAKSTGERCKRKTTDASGLCSSHRYKSSSSKKTKATQCTAIAKSTGERCKRKTTDESGLCSSHRGN